MIMFSLPFETFSELNFEREITYVNSDPEENEWIVSWDKVSAS